MNRFSYMIWGVNGFFCRKNYEERRNITDADKRSDSGTAERIN